MVNRGEVNYTNCVVLKYKKQRLITVLYFHYQQTTKGGVSTWTRGMGGCVW